MNNKKLLEQLYTSTQKPDVFSESTSKFWDDEHISKMMLDAHLNPTFDAATRRGETVDKTVDWLNTIAQEHQLTSILDLGCGPGIYASKLYQLGYNVTGVDLSPRSIEYAKDQAALTNENITYINADYTTMSSIGTFDLIALIYCDYGVLPKEKRRKVLELVKDSLSENGLFVFDVFTPLEHETRQEISSHYTAKKSGFFKNEPHTVLENKYFYDTNIVLDQYTVITEDLIDVYRVWDQQFTVEDITNELDEAGLKVKAIYSDLTGKPYHNQSKMMGIVVSK